MLEIELAEPFLPILLAEGHGGAHVLVRLKGRPVGRIWISRSKDGSFVEADVLKRKIASNISDTAAQALFSSIEKESGPAPMPDLTIAICTRNRAPLLGRCLKAILQLVGGLDTVSVLVVDNAPSDPSTEELVRSFESVRYVLEPVPGLDFGRNRAISHSATKWLAFVDDDAVVDRGWLASLAEGIAQSPDAGAFTGPILPLVLDTEARLRFELAGGFGKGFTWQRFSSQRSGDAIHPANAGDFGTGASMALSTAALGELKGFDEALDTGPPLAGGGDLDIFYRLLRSGKRVVYLPGLVVHHEHRADMVGLRRQYFSWGLTITALMQKNMVSDPAMRPAHIRMLQSWLRSKLRELARACVGAGPRKPHLVLAELHGAVVGYFGEYERSQLRVEERKRKHAL